MTTAARYHLIRIVAALRRLLRRAPVLSREHKARMKQELMSEHIVWYATVSNLEKGRRDE